MWIWSLFITGCSFIALHDIDLGGKSLSYYIMAYLSRFYLKKYVMPAYIIVVSVIVVVSSLTVREVLRKSFRKTAENYLRNSGPRTKRPNAAESACTIMLVLLAYILCFIVRILFIFAFLFSNKPSQWYFFLAQFCLFCGSTCNYFIYSARSTEFRNAWRETFKCNKNFKNQVHDNQKKAGKVFYINGALGKKVVIIHWLTETQFIFNMLLDRDGRSQTE